MGNVKDKNAETLYKVCQPYLPLIVFLNQK